MTVILSERELCSLAQLGTNSLTLVRFRAELQCPAMDDDSLDEFEDQTPGPDAHPPLSAAALARDAGEPSPPLPASTVRARRSCTSRRERGAACSLQAAAPGTAEPLAVVSMSSTCVLISLKLLLAFKLLEWYVLLCTFHGRDAEIERKPATSPPPAPPLPRAPGSPGLVCASAWVVTLPGPCFCLCRSRRKQ